MTDETTKNLIEKYGKICDRDNIPINVGDNLLVPCSTHYGSAYLKEAIVQRWTAKTIFFEDGSRLVLSKTLQKNNKMIYDVFHIDEQKKYNRETYPELYV